MRLSTLLTLLTMLLPAAWADCTADPNVNPLVMTSVDFYDAFSGDYEGCACANSGLYFTSQEPYCVQGAEQTFTTAPLQFYYWIDYGFISELLFGDNGSGPIPFYPYFAYGAAEVDGIDISSGVPFLGQAYLELTIFAQYV